MRHWHALVDAADNADAVQALRDSTGFDLDHRVRAQMFSQLVDEDPRGSPANPLLSRSSTRASAPT